MNKAFKEGLKSGFSLKPSSRIREKIPELSVEQRIRRNWQSVGNDMKTSLDKFNKTLGKKHVK